MAPLKMRVAGMDCGACALKIENALKRLPGVSDINVNYGAETLTLTLDEDRTPRTAIEDRIRALGYLPRPLAGDSRRISRHTEHDDPAGGRAWLTTKGRLAAAAGAPLALAFVVGEAVPALSFPAYLVAAVIGVVPVVRRAVAGAVSGTFFGIETLMSIAVIGAIAIGAAEEAAVVIFLFAVGEFLEHVAAGRARAGIAALMDLVPRMARVEAPGRIQDVAVDELRIGDIVLVRPGDRVPSDGEVVEGRSEMDQAPVTGESVPVAVGAGSPLYAGSINANGVLRVRITRTAADNTIARIIHLVEEAQGSKAPTARFIERFAAAYTPAAMLVAGLIVVVPPVLFGADWSTSSIAVSPRW
jgi:Zn2+/Cd2+-exporting ATPase